MSRSQDSLPVDKRIELVLIREFFEKSRGNPYGIAVTGVLSYLILVDSGVPEFSLRIWLVLILLSALAMLLFELWVGKNGLSAENASARLRVRFVLGGIAGALVGASSLLLPADATTTAFALVFIILSSVVAIGYMAYSTAYRYCLAVHLLCFVPYTLACFHRYSNNGPTFFLLMGLTSVFWQCIMVWKSLQVSRATVGEIEARVRLHDEMNERRQTEILIREREEDSTRIASMLRLMCDNVPDMIWAKDLENRYVFANRALCEKLLNAVDTDEPVGKTYEYFLRREQARNPDDPDWHTYGPFSEDVDRHALSRSEATSFEESGMVRGKFVYLEVQQSRFVNTAGEVIGTVGCARDITGRKAAESLVEHLAHHDALTDLPNRVLLADRLRQALAQARRDRGKLGVLFIDLDRLKPVNDSLGHAVGDLLLKEVADRLRRSLSRESDTVSRLGGDEFVVLLQRLNTPQDAALIAERILFSISQPFHVLQHVISISASIGIAIFPADGDEGSTLLKNADVAMYSAKHAGRNAYRFYDPLAA